jgi:hypothetical protein
LRSASASGSSIAASMSSPSARQNANEKAPDRQGRGLFSSAPTF